MTGQEWVARFAEEIGLESPSEESFDAILALAASAAHGSERIAAPVACWLAAQTGRPLAELIEVAEGIGSAED